MMAIIVKGARVAEARSATRLLKAAGIRAGIFCTGVDYARAMAAKGFDLVTVESDEALLMKGAERLAQFRQIM